MENEFEIGLHCCCFTGHRPEKLSQPEHEIIAALEREIRSAFSEGFVYYISGMTRGVDIWAAEIILRMKEEGLPVNLICAVPFKGFEQSWSDSWKQRYNSALAAADLVKCISPACFQIRNEWMVDHSSRVIAVFNGKKGGTKNTIRYAARNGIPVIFAI